MTRKIVYLPDPTITFYCSHEDESIFYASTDCQDMPYGYKEVIDSNFNVDKAFISLLKILTQASALEREDFVENTQHAPYFNSCLSHPRFYEVLDV